MNSSLMLSMTTWGYGFATIMYMISWIFKKTRAATFGRWLLVFGIIIHVLGIALRWIESYQMGIGHAPLSNMYESLVFFSLTVALIYIYVEYKYHTSIFGIFATPVIFLTIAYASLSPNINDRIQPLIPALKSNWLIAHVLTCFLGYSAFALAFGMSCMYLLKQRQQNKPKSIWDYLPELNLLDELTYQMIMFGFLFLTIGIITGAVWANSAWGSYWSWDPKETWSLITWFIYAIYLHARLMRGWEGERVAYISIIGFMAVLFTYFGVNYLPGLHSYA
ncbi:MAG: c-type cytochrome biogenesis protein CcsB [Desulfobacterales bacterium]|nr:c-type cytochrome biogenesis protein CcsB [Desulfobacterales bacterium]